MHLDRTKIYREYHRFTLKQEQQRVAVGPGNAQFTSVRQVSSDAATLRRCTFSPPLLLFCCRRHYCSTAAADIKKFTDY